MRRVVRWVFYAAAAWLGVNAAAYPASCLMPKGGTTLQNFTMTLIVGFVMVMLFADILYIKHVGRMGDTAPAPEGAVREDLVGTIIQFDYPLFITALLLAVQIVAIYRVAF